MAGGRARAGVPGSAWPAVRVPGWTWPAVRVPGSAFPAVWVPRSVAVSAVRIPRSVAVSAAGVRGRIAAAVNQPSQQAGYQAGPQPTQQPGYQGGPGPGYPSEPWQSQPPPRRTSGWDSISDASSLEEGIVDAVLGGATKAIGRAIGRRMRQAYNERLAPAMAARQESVLRERIAIAQRHPDLRACLSDQVIFLVGGTRVLPLASAMRVQTVEQSDALVAQLR